MTMSQGGDSTSRAGRSATFGSFWLGRVALIPVIGGVVVALLVAVRANLYFMHPSAALLHEFDEAYAVAFARRMLEGHFLPYVDGVSHRAPLFYVSTALAVKLFGNGTWMPVRALSLLTIASTIVFGCWAAASARRLVASAVMALVYAGVLCLAMPLKEGLAYNSEQLLSMFAMASLGCLVLALEGRARARTWWAFLAGVALSASGLSKQTGFVVLLPFGMWIATVAIGDSRLGASERKSLPFAFAFGVALPLLVLVARYAVAGELSTLYYYLVTYNTKVYLAEFFKMKSARDTADAISTHFYVLAAFAPFIGWVVLSPFRRVRRLGDVPRIYAEHGFELTVAVATLITPFAADSSLRNLEHYYVQVVPWAGLLLGVLLEQMLAGAPLLLARTVTLLPLILVVELGWQHHARAFERDVFMRERFTTRDSLVCRFLDAHTKPSDSLFIWGFWPIAYTACNRRPASRYVYTTFVSGYVPHVNDDPKNDAARVAPGSQQILHEELTRERPPVIIDAPLTLGLRSLSADEFLRTFVASDYCEQHVDLGQPGARAWVRRGWPGCPAGVAANH